MTVQECYATLGGNYQEAIGRLMNDALIKRLLGKFVSTYSLSELETAVKNQDGHEIFERVHALKGVVGNLALTKLYNLASELTEKTRGCAVGDKYEASVEYATIALEFDKTVSVIKDCLSL
ncbi:MAG: Hpt domain-containing protein [Bacilli bacterium]|nr:Hpt domain-containing protein [Bacilli bacterium]